MKLMNRGPTEEMIRAGSYVLRNVNTSLTEAYQAMHDAAPEIKVDMHTLEAALKAERIKALEQLADKVCTFQTRQGKLYITPREIRTMANELKEQ